MKGEAIKVTAKDVEMAQLLIEKCLQLYMKRSEIVNMLHHQAQIAPGFTEHVLDKLEKENQEFFSAYNKMLILKDQIIRFNRLLEMQVERMQHLNNVVPTTLATHSTYQHQAYNVTSQRETGRNGVDPTTLATGSQTHSMSNHSAYQYQTSEVNRQTRMKRNRVVPTALANGSWTHSMNDYSAYQQEAHEVMTPTHMTQNGDLSTHLANGSRMHSRNYSAYQHEPPDIMSQRQLSQHGIVSAALATGSLRHSRNNYSAYQHRRHEVINQTQMSQNGVVHSPFANGLQTHSMNNYSGYQHQAPEVMSQIQMSQNGVIPAALANRSKAPSLSNYSAFQDQTLVVPSVASENMQHMTNFMPNFYGNGFLESYNNVNGEASIPPNSGRESDTMTYDEAVLAAEMNLFVPNRVNSSPDLATGFSTCNGMLSNYSVPPFLRKDDAAQQSSDSDGL